MNEHILFLIIANIDLQYLNKLSPDMPVWNHRRYDLYGDVTRARTNSFMIEYILFLIIANIDLQYLNKLSQDMPVWNHRRYDLYGDVTRARTNSFMIEHTLFLIIANIDLQYLHKVRQAMPGWNHRRYDLYGDVTQAKEEPTHSWLNTHYSSKVVLTWDMQSVVLISDQLRASILLCYATAKLIT